MADAVVNILFQNLNALLIQEVSLLRSLHGNFKQIKLELDSMRAFLRDADRRQGSNDGLITWVGQVRDAAYDVEDMIDEFKYRMDKPQRGASIRFLRDPIRNIWYKHHFGTQLQELASKIASISAGKRRYNLTNTEGPSLYSANERIQRHGDASFFINDDETVGLKGKIEQLIRWLIEEEPRRTAISVVGMGGSGKTTLVAQVFKNQMIKKHFNCSVWVSVSRSYNIEALLKSVITDLFRANMVQVPSDLDSMNHRQLLQMTNEFLDTKKYIVILDDIWSFNAWTELNIAFPRNKCGSRIMVTTRHEDVASVLGDGSRMYQLKLLPEGEAWDLFSKNAFWKEPCPHELQPLARSIVQKCGGLPLAIVALSRLMSLKQNTMSDWNRVYNNLSEQLRSNRLLEPVKRILRLSFYDLPYRLKHCFLYCCVYPEDYLIHRKQLIRLLVAEGFVEDGGRITMEEAAEDYLKELVHRSMLQVVETNEFGRMRAFRVHDMMREVALSLSDEEKFCCMMYDGKQAGEDGKVRRMSIYNCGEIPQSSSMSMLSHLRSLLVFDKSTSFSSSLNSMAWSFRLLRVLYLEGVLIEKVPDELSILFNLRYLNLRRTRVRELPESLASLQNLETLDLRDTMIERLPERIMKLKKLRHLFIYRITDEEYKSFTYFTSVKVPLGIYSITSLQTLTPIEAEDGKMVKQVGNLTQLRKLGITNLKAIHGEELCTSVRKMKHLLWLGVQTISEEELLKLEALSPNPPPLLQKLQLHGRLEKVPQWLRSLTNLTCIWLRWSQLSEEEDPLPLLTTLPNLVFVALEKAYQGQMLRFHNGGFPKLKILILNNLTQLNQLVIEQGAMPRIQRLDLHSCGELKMVPQGIEYLIGLKELNLLIMPVELVERLRLKDGNRKHGQKVDHIPLIRHFFKEGGKWFVEPLN